MTIKSKDLHKIDELAEAVLKIFIGEELLSDGLVDVVFEDGEIFGGRFGYLFDKVRKLVEVEAPDIILVFSHRLEYILNHHCFLLWHLTESCQHSHHPVRIHKLRILHDNA